MTDKVSLEKRNRLLLLLAAHAYERMHLSIMTDHEFDQLALQIDLTVDTDNAVWDKWWRDNFDSCTGSWVWRHPDPAGLTRRVEELQGRKNISARK